MWVPCLCLDQLGLVHPERFRLPWQVECCYCGRSGGVFVRCFPIGGEAGGGFVAGRVLPRGLLDICRCGPLLGLCCDQFVGCHCRVMSSLAAGGFLWCWCCLCCFSVVGLLVLVYLGLVQLENVRLLGQLEGLHLGLAGVKLLVPSAVGRLV